MSQPILQWPYFQRAEPTAEETAEQLKKSAMSYEERKKYANEKHLRGTAEDLKNSLCFCRCPQCKAIFKLKWDDYDNASATLLCSSCPSGGMYAVKICCPFCDFEEEL